MSVSKLAEGKWRADWRDTTGKRHRRLFRTKTAADKFLRDEQDKRDRGESTAPVPTVAEFIPQFAEIKQPTVRAQTWRSYEMHLRLYIEPRLGEIPLGRLDHREQQLFFSSLVADGKSIATAHRIFATLSVLMKVGATLGYCSLATKKVLTIPRSPAYTLHPPTVAQIEALAEKIDPRFHALIILCGYCGLRQGEALALHPSAIDWKRHRIRVYQTLERNQKRIDQTKGRRERTVTLAARVQEALKNHISEYPCPDWVFHRNGQPVESTWFHHEVWDPARRAVGLPTVRFQDLRHAAATVQAQLAGWGPKKVQVELGHSTAAFTLDRYQHLWAEHEDSARERLDDALAAELAKAKENCEARA